MLLYNPWVKEKFTRDIGEHFNLMTKKNTTHQILWDMAKAMLRGKCIVLNAYIRKRKNLKPVICVTTARNW